MAPHPEGLRWYQIPLSSARIPRSGLFSYGFQASLQRYQQLRALKNLRVGRPIAPPPPGLLKSWPPGPPPANSPPRVSHRPRGAGRARGERGPVPGTGVRGAVTLLWTPRCPKEDPCHPHVVPTDLVPQGGVAWSPLRCPYSPPCAIREPPVTPALSPQPSLCPKGAPGHLHCPQSSLGPQGGPWSSLSCPRSPSCTPRETPVTPTLSSQPSLCPKGGPGHLHCPHSPLAPQGKDLVTPGLSPQPPCPKEGWEAWSPLHCPHGPPPAPRGPPVTPALSPWLSLSPKGICGDPCAVPTAPQRPKKSPGTRKRVSRGQQPPGPAQPHANQQDAASRDSPGCQVAPDSSGHVPVLPEAAARSLGGEANHGQRPAAGTVLQQAGRSFGGNLPGTTGGTASPTDSEDDDLIPLKDMLLAGDEPLSSADHQQVGPCLRVGALVSGGPWGLLGSHWVLWLVPAENSLFLCSVAQVVCPQPDLLANSLDSLIQEKR